MTKANTHIFLKQIKSNIGTPEKIRQVLRGLGLKRINSTSTLNDTPAIRGMVVKVQHLVAVEVRPGIATPTSARSRARALK